MVKANKKEVVRAERRRRVRANEKNGIRYNLATEGKWRWENWNPGMDSRTVPTDKIKIKEWLYRKKPLARAPSLVGKKRPAKKVRVKKSDPQAN